MATDTNLGLYPVMDDDGEMRDTIKGHEVVLRWHPTEEHKVEVKTSKGAYVGTFTVKNLNRDQIRDKIAAKL